jgi:hypothetical protein
MKTVYLHHTPIQLDPAALIQSGGEGMVFAYSQSAIKLYHQPEHHHAEKLCHFLQTRLNQRLPEGVLGPQAIVSDKNGNVLGFQMARLEGGTRPLKLLSNPGFMQKEGLQLGQVLALFRNMHETLTQLHGLNLVVGDLNDQNLFWLPTSGRVFWIDVDSYQFDRFPCPVALQTFLDPQLYHIADFRLRPVFTPLTDWYAFTTLLVKSMLQVHPYGGTHPQQKTLAGRAAAHISLLHPSVTYPKRANPPETLPDDWLHLIHRIYEKGERLIFPLSLLEQFARRLITCQGCGLTYSAERRDCPACRHQTPVVAPITKVGQMQLRCLLRVDGVIVHVAVQPTGRMIVVYRSGADYRVVQTGVGGMVQELMQFSGREGYRFAWLDQVLVVNPPGSQQLLLLDLSQPSPRRLAMLETALFQEEAVFASTGSALIRVAGTTILRGRIQEGLFVEEMIGTAHHNQTQLWGSGGIIGGVNRVFGDYHLFWWDQRGRVLELPPITPQPGESIGEITFYAHDGAIAFLLERKRGGQAVTQVLLLNHDGKLVRQWEVAAAPPHDLRTGKALVGTTLLHATDEGILKEMSQGNVMLRDAAAVTTNADWLHPHPAGLLIQQVNALYIAQAG